jgi:hypothetical protein
MDMAFQVGNQEAKKGEKKKRFKQQLVAILEEIHEGETTKLRKVAENLVHAGIAGDVQAIKEIRDTIDGKPAQAIIGGDDDDKPVGIQLIRTTIVDPRPRDGTGI